MTSILPVRWGSSLSSSATSTPRSMPARSVPTMRAPFGRRSTWFDQVLGVIQLRRREESAPPVPVDEIERLIEERRAARSRRDFAKADEIRHGLAARGIILEDSAGGTRWKRK